MLESDKLNLSKTSAIILPLFLFIGGVIGFVFGAGKSWQKVEDQERISNKNDEIIEVKIEDLKEYMREVHLELLGVTTTADSHEAEIRRLKDEHLREILELKIKLVEK